MNAADRRRLTPVLVGIAIVLGGLLIAFWSGLAGAPRWHARAAPPRLPPVGANLPPPTVPPLEHFDTVWQHPLFSPDRMPHAVASTGPGSSGNLQLTGVIMRPGLKMAIVHDKTTGKDYRVREGSPSNGGPALLELHPRSAVLDVSGSRVQLKLMPGPSPDAGTAPAANPAPASSSQSGPTVMVEPQPSIGMHAAKSSPSRATAAARARALKARIEAERRRARQQGGG